ncbi:hypothetical protein BT96DRAFT_850413 [Gymnopus androsaceus JB14]|uniref:Uncharacterized protein n=1 Tax=Gymnopus androsaceus JB14 TaxID=1447944 RepID=A0A6A4IFA7_9AGAR|nr:hypothetical protein BT96DRAFT_850413 [Gymnopus androsaceus JB14]
MHNTKSKAKGISASSFLDLQAELSKKKEQFEQEKTAGKSRYIVGGVQRPDKKPTVWGQRNRGVKNRAERDEEQEIISKPTLDSARAALERKTKLYDQLKKGKSGGISDKQFDSLLVDFDAKGISNSYESDSDDVDESLTVPVPLVNDEDDDPIIEYTDEFGRTRTDRRSEVPRHLMPKPEEEEEGEDEDEGVLYNPQGHFPTYEPTEERISKIEQQYAEDTEPPEKHYDPNTENRARGAAFYQLPTRGDDRRTRIEELKSEHVTTQAVREQMGAINVRPGEVEGMRASESSSRASEKRKREIEDRRRLVDAKRKKAKGVTAESQPAATPVFTASTVAGESQPAATPVFTASAAAESNRTTLPPPRPTDPFAALEATMPPSNKVKPNTNHEADDFLAQLENGLLNRGR